MSLAEVIAELPSLSPRERRELALRLIELDSNAAEADDMAVCEQTAIAGFAMLDAMEARDSRP